MSGLDELRALADLLTRKSEEIGHPIYILSDEPYRRIVFDGLAFHSPAEVYPSRSSLLVRQAAAGARHARRLLHVVAEDARPREACARTPS